MCPIFHLLSHLSQCRMLVREFSGHLSHAGFFRWTPCPSGNMAGVYSTGDCLAGNPSAFGRNAASACVCTLWQDLLRHISSHLLVSCRFLSTHSLCHQIVLYQPPGCDIFLYHFLFLKPVLVTVCLEILVFETSECFHFSSQWLTYQWITQIKEAPVW